METSSTSTLCWSSEVSASSLPHSDLPPKTIRSLIVPPICLFPQAAAVPGQSHLVAEAAHRHHVVAGHLRHVPGVASAADHRHAGATMGQAGPASDVAHHRVAIVDARRPVVAALVQGELCACLFVCLLAYLLVLLAS